MATFADGAVRGVAVITGAGRGIGRNLAQYLAGTFRPLVLVARTATELAESARAVEAAGGVAVTRPLDVTDEEAVTRLFQEVVAPAGPLRLVVNNAGRFRGIGPVAEVSVQAWWRDVSVNLLGSFLVARAAIPVLRRGQGPRYIINVVGGGFAEPLANGSGYAASKAALARLTDCLAVELEDAGIAVFGLGPGFHHTALAE
nr:SDR family NAD(P)-dependent oxidoreductase [Thermaerobacter sp.]